MTTGHSEIQPAARWHVLLRPRWLGWHAFVLLATAGMLLLGNWQLHRAESGNSLSWAYTFEWPLFSAFTIYFWFKSLRDELHGHGAASAESDSATAVQNAGVGSTSDSWDATSWDAASWHPTSPAAGAAGTGKPADLARATPADGDAYVARLMAEVRGSGRRRPRR